jgi:hypothetical protein
VALVDRRPGERPGIVEFPNLFTLTGPGNLSVLTKMLPSIEHHVEWPMRRVSAPQRNQPN